MEKRVGIIGAGVSGVLACKYTLEKGFNPIVFEAEGGIGGVWAYGTIASTRLQTGKHDYQFSDFPWPDSVTDTHPTHTQTLEYIESYAQHFRLFSCIKFNSKVTGIDYVGESYEEMESWDRWGGTGKPFDSKGKWHIKVEDVKNGTKQVYYAEFVILCIGQFSGLPNIPQVPPNQGPEVFKGKVTHSMEYSALDSTSAAEFIKSKRVIVVGSHKTGLEIAAECANTNGIKYPCMIVQRNAHWSVPLDDPIVLALGFFYFNRFSQLLVHKPGGALLFSFMATLLTPLRRVISKFIESYLRCKFPLKKFAMLPKISFHEGVASCNIIMLPDKLYDRLEEGSIIIKNSPSFHFCEDGIIVEGEKEPIKTDMVIFATGFKGDEKLKCIFESSKFQDCITGSTTALYRQILHPEIPQLAVIGYNESFSTLNSAEMKSLWLAHFLDGKLELPCIREMKREAKLWGDHIKQVSGRNFKRGCISTTTIWYNDQLCNDMGFNPRRKHGFFAELFSPYSATDYAGLSTASTRSSRF